MTRHTILLHDDDARKFKNKIIIGILCGVVRYTYSRHKIAMLLLLILVFLPAITVANAASGCCIGNAGGAVLSGGGSISISGETQLTGASIGASPSSSFVAVLVGISAADTPGAGPNDAEAGWIVTSAANGSQVLTFWSGNKGGSTAQCQRSSAPAGTFVSTFALCTGTGALFETPTQTYSLGATSVNVWAQRTNQSYLGVTADACTPVGLSGASSPLQQGSFTFVFTDTSASAPPDSWALAPTACGFHA